MIKNLSVIKKFLMLLIVLIIGMSGLYAVSTYTISKTSIGSVAYTNIIDSKDLLADILPPPLYAFQSYLHSAEMLAAKDINAVNTAVDAVKKEKLEFEQRYQFWNNKKTDPSIKFLLINEVYPTGMKFFEVIENKLVPAAKSLDKAAMEEIFTSTIVVEYLKHRHAVDSLSKLLDEFASKANENGESAVAQGSLYFTSFFVIVLLIVVLLSIVISKDITGALNKCGGFARNIADGNLNTKLALNRGDDFGKLGQSLSDMLEELKRKILLSEEKNLSFRTRNN